MNSTLTVRGTDGNDNIAIQPTGVANEARVWVNAGAVVTGNAGGANNTFATVLLQGRFGNDAFSITPIAGVAITAQGNDPAASDSAVIHGTLAADAIAYTPTASDAATGFESSSWKVSSRASWTKSPTTATATSRWRSPAAKTTVPDPGR